MEKYTADYNPYINFNDHFVKQAGQGYNGYEGEPYPVGQGLGKILSYIPKALKFIGRFGLTGLKSFGSDILEGKDIETAGKNALANTAQHVIKEATDKLNKFKGQKGSGRKRKTKTVTKKPTKRAKTARKTVRKTAKTTKKPVRKKRKNIYKTTKSISNYI